MSKASITTAKELATLLGRSPTTLMNRPGWTWSKSGPWKRSDLPAMLRFAATTIRETGDTGGALADLKRQKLEQEIRRIQKSADCIDHELSRLRGEYVNVEDLRRWISEHVGGAKNRFVALPARLSVRLVGCDAVEIERALEQEFKQIFDELYRGAAAVSGTTPEALQQPAAR